MLTSSHMNPYGVSWTIGSLFSEQCALEIITTCDELQEPYHMQELSKERLLTKMIEDAEQFL